MFDIIVIGGGPGGYRAAERAGHAGLSMLLIEKLALGGGDYYENYQFLYGNCNRIKGDRPMEYLRLKTETCERMKKNKIFFGE